MPGWHGHGWSWSQDSWYEDACGYFLWDFLKVDTTKELQQVMRAVLNKVSKEL